MTNLAENDIGSIIQRNKPHGQATYPNHRSKHEFGFIEIQIWAHID